MSKRISLATLLLLAIVSTAFADVDVVLDDFESYGTAADLQAVWVSTGAAGDPLNSTFLENPSDGTYHNFDGQAAVFDGTIGIGAGSVNQWQKTSISAAPSATQNVEITVDLGHDQLTSNKKLTLGLRYIDEFGATENIIELGYFNQFPQGPNGEFFQFGHRAVLFPGGDNWQPYGLDESLDQIHEIGPVGPGPDGEVVPGFFHRFKAIISETDVTFTVDLYADGINNAASGYQADFDGDNDVDGDDYLIWQRGFGDTYTNVDLANWQDEFGGPPPADIPGPDATDVVAASVWPSGFNTLQFGIPSGQSGGGGSSADPFLAVDNVSLRLVDIPQTTAATAAVPEPTAACLMLLATAGMTLAARRRR